MTRVTTLASHYSQIADNVTTNLFNKIKEEVEKEFSTNAESGSRNFIWYPSPKASMIKEEIIKWLQDEGCAVVWKYYHKDGNWVEIAY